jgi:hypothetical protein
MGFFSIRSRFQNQPVAFKRPRHCRSLTVNKRFAPFAFFFQRDTESPCMRRGSQATVTRDHVLLASSGQSDGFIDQNLCRTELEDSTKFAEMSITPAHLKRMQEPPSVKKRLAHEKSE